MPRPRSPRTGRSLLCALLGGSVALLAALTTGCTADSGNADLPDLSCAIVPTPTDCLTRSPDGMTGGPLPDGMMGPPPDGMMPPRDGMMGPRSCTMDAECTGSCGPGAMGCKCYMPPMAPGKVCAATCTLDADCPTPMGGGTLRCDTTQGVCVPR
jgi:hypothetical protein